MKKYLFFINLFSILSIHADHSTHSSTEIQDQTIVMDIRTSYATHHICSQVYDRIAILKKNGTPFEVTFVSKTPEREERYTIIIKSLMPQKKACEMKTISCKTEYKKKTPLKECYELYKNTSSMYNFL